MFRGGLGIVRGYQVSGRLEVDLSLIDRLRGKRPLRFFCLPVSVRPAVLATWQKASPKYQQGLPPMTYKFQWCSHCRQRCAAAAGVGRVRLACASLVHILEEEDQMHGEILEEEDLAYGSSQKVRLACASLVHILEEEDQMHSEILEEEDLAYGSSQQGEARMCLPCPQDVLVGSHPILGLSRVSPASSCGQRADHKRVGLQVPGHLPLFPCP
eukprot:548947-Pelagomonas_calceolata.AAC.1